MTGKWVVVVVVVVVVMMVVVRVEYLCTVLRLRQKKVGPRELSLRNLQCYRCIILALMVGESYIRYFCCYCTKQPEEELKSLLFQIRLLCFCNGSTSVF